MFKTQTFKDKSFKVVMGSTHPDYSYYTFEVEERDFKEKYWNIKEHDVVFDVGSSYGGYTLPACTMGAFVYSFEPEPSVFNDLVSNIKLNNWKESSILMNIGLWDKSDKIDMKSYAPHWPKGTISGDYHMMALDDVVEMHDVSKIDWIKIDVEGAEENVIKGAMQSIEKWLPNLIIECHVFLNDKIIDNIKSMLSKFPYEIEEVDRDPCIMLIAKRKV